MCMCVCACVCVCACMHACVRVLIVLLLLFIQGLIPWESEGVATPIFRFAKSKCDRQVECLILSASLADEEATSSPSYHTPYKATH